MKNSITWIVFKKELKDIFRDKKTLIMSIVIPVVLFPLLFGIMGRSANSAEKKVTNNLSIAIKDESKSSLGEFIRQQKNIKIKDSKDIAADVKSGKILLGIEIPSGFDSGIKDESTASITITYDNVSQDSSTAMNLISSYIDAYSKTVVAGRLAKRNINPDILNPVKIDAKTSVKEKDSMGRILLSMLLPLLIGISCAVGPVAPATDLGAGEKERGTLEPLLTTQAGRMSLLTGKLLAITVMGIITNVAYLGGVYVSMKQKNGYFQGASGASFNLEPKAMILIGVIAILTTLAFAALELAISIYARSFKEAQTYLSPITIVALVPTYATFMLDGKNIENFYFNIPLGNLICLMKEILAGTYNTSHIAITFGWVLFYIVISIIFARYMFSREEVVFRT